MPNKVSKLNKGNNLYININYIYLIFLGKELYYSLYYSLVLDNK